ncbi:hypothetical protein BOX15_Mlig006895g1, partial [Macrostomum lignano]
SASDRDQHVLKALQVLSESVAVSISDFCSGTSNSVYSALLSQLNVLYPGNYGEKDLKTVCCDIQQNRRQLKRKISLVLNKSTNVVLETEKNSDSDSSHDSVVIYELDGVWTALEQARNDSDRCKAQEDMRCMLLAKIELDIVQKCSLSVQRSDFSNDSARTVIYVLKCSAPLSEERGVCPGQWKVRVKGSTVSIKSIETPQEHPLKAGRVRDKNLKRKLQTGLIASLQSSVAAHANDARGMPSSKTLTNIRQYEKTKERICKDNAAHDLLLRIEHSETISKYVQYTQFSGNSSLLVISLSHPHLVADVLYSMKKSKVPINLIIDSTGASVTTSSWPGVLPKKLYHYALVLPSRGQLNQVSLLDVLSCLHDKVQLSIMLAKWWREILGVPGYGSFRIAKIVTDFNWPTLHALLQVFNGLNIEDYLNWCYLVGLQDDNGQRGMPGWLRATLKQARERVAITLGRSHIMNEVRHWPEVRNANRQVQAVYLQGFAKIVASTSAHEGRIWLQNLLHILLERDSMKALPYVKRIRSEQAADLMDAALLDRSDEEDDEKSRSTIRASSRFYHEAREFLQRISVACRQVALNSVVMPNAYLNEALAARFVDLYAFFPLFSSMMENAERHFTRKASAVDFRNTEGSVEVYHRTVRRDVLGGRSQTLIGFFNLNGGIYARASSLSISLSIIDYRLTAGKFSS